MNLLLVPMLVCFKSHVSIMFRPDEPQGQDETKSQVGGPLEGHQGQRGIGEPTSLQERTKPKITNESKVKKPGCR